MNKHELSRSSIREIAYICEQCLEHNSSWVEFRERVLERLEHEEKMTKILLSEEWGEKHE